MLRLQRPPHCQPVRPTLRRALCCERFDVLGAASPSCCIKTFAAPTCTPPAAAMCTSAATSLFCGTQQEAPGGLAAVWDKTSNPETFHTECFNELRRASQRRRSTSLAGCSQKGTGTALPW